MPAVTNPTTVPVFETDVLDEHIRILSQDKPIATFGLKGLNKLLGGIYPGQNYAIGAHPGCGKTTLILQEADKLASDGHTVIFVSAELPHHKLLAKSISRLSEGKLALVEVADAAAAEHPKHETFEVALSEYRNNIAPNLCITGSLSVTDLGCLVSSCIHKRKQIPIVFIDYLQLFAAGSTTEPFVDERLAIAACVRGLRDISTCYNTPIIVLSTVTRSAYASKKPGLEAFGGTASIEYGFDAGLFLTEANIEMPFESWGDRALRLTATKNRYGSLDSAIFSFDGAHATFRDMN